MSKKAKIGAAIAGLFALSVLGFVAYKGTFNTVTYIEQKGNTYLLYGKPYDGPIRDKAWMDIFQEMEKIAAEDSAFKLAAYYESEPTEENNYSVKAFVGILSNEKITNVNPLFLKEHHDLTEKKVSFDQSISASKNASPFFQRLFADASKYCMEKGYQIDDNLLLEIYHSEEFMEVVAPYTIAKDTTSQSL